MIELLLVVIYYVAFFIIGFGDGYEEDWIIGLGFIIAIVDLVVYFVMNWDKGMGDITVGWFAVVFVVELISFIFVEVLGSYVGRWYKRRRW